MDNQFWGIITISLCVLGYLLSWKFQRKESWTIALCLLMICGLLLRVFTSCDFFLHIWDERFHALVAKNMIHHLLKPTLYDHPVLPFDYKNWTSNHIWLSKPPLALWLISASIYLFGNNEIAIRIPSIIVSTFCILLTYKIAKALFNKKIAWLAAFLNSIHGLLIETAAGRVSSDLVETVFIFFVELGVLFAVLSIQNKKKHLFWMTLCGLAIGFSLLSKWLPGLIVLPIWLFYAYSHPDYPKNNLLKGVAFLFGITMLVALPWFIFIRIQYSRAAEAMFKGIFIPLFESIQGHDGSIWYYLNKIRMVYGEIIYLPLCWLLFWVFKNNRKMAQQRSLRLLSVWIFIPLIIFSFAETKRFIYLLICAPAMFMLTAILFYEVANIKIYRKYSWLFHIIMFLLIALPIRYSIERIKPFKKTNRNPDWAIALRDFKPKNAHHMVLFNYSRPIAAMFYTNLRAVYPLIPNQKDINKLNLERYSVLINSPSNNIPQSIKELQNVIIVHLVEQK